MKMFLLIASCLFGLAGCSQGTSGQHKVNEPEAGDLRVGARCEGCEAIYEATVPFGQLNATDTLPDFVETGPRLCVSGTFYRKDGKTPAAGVVMYFYHTDQTGRYPTRGNEKGVARQHGYLRGWIRTGKDGAYTFYTLVPASYPNSNNPKHIHAIIKEPGKTAYWIDDFVFADDPLLPESEKRRPKPVCGSGVLTTSEKNGMRYATRDIILGLNVENYR